MDDIADRSLDLYETFNTAQMDDPDADDVWRQRKALVEAMDLFDSRVDATEWHHMDLDRFHHGLKLRRNELAKIYHDLDDKIPDQATDGLVIITQHLDELLDGGFPDPSYGETTEEILEHRVKELAEVAGLIRDVLKDAKRQSSHLHHLEENAFE